MACHGLYFRVLGHTAVISRRGVSVISVLNSYSILIPVVVFPRCNEDRLEKHHPGGGGHDMWVLCPVHWAANRGSSRGHPHSGNDLIAFVIEITVLPPWEIFTFACCISIDIRLCRWSVVWWKYIHMKGYVLVYWKVDGFLLATSERNAVTTVLGNEYLVVLSYIVDKRAFTTRDTIVHSLIPPSMFF